MNLRRKIILFVGLLSLLYTGESVFANSSIVRVATYYSDKFEGRRTANGDIFSQDVYSAAICDIPLGQFLFVQKGGTGVVVEANDRPNCAKNPQVIDLSQKVFRDFAPLSVGRISEITVTPISPSTQSVPKKFLSQDAFSHLGIMLESDIPTILFSGEGITIRGRVLNDEEFVLIFFAHNQGSTKKSHLFRVNSDKTFQADVPLPEREGDYSLVIASGKSFYTDRYEKIHLLNSQDLLYPSFPLEKQRISVRVNPGQKIPTISLPENIWGEMYLRQGNRTFSTQGKAFIFSDVPLVPGSAQVQISGYRLSTPSPLDRGSRIPSLFSGSVFLDRVYDVIGKERVNMRIRNNIANIRFKTPTDRFIRSKYYITSPDGLVEELTLAHSHSLQNGLLPQNTSFQISFPLRQEGTYILEIVNEDGTAYVNLPVFQGRVWHILRPFSQEEIEDITMNSALAKKEVLTRMNTLRKLLGFQGVSEDPQLSRLAQAKVDDMIDRGYVAHIDPDGRDIAGLAKSLGIRWSGKIGENIANGTVSHLFLQDGLEYSGVHRHNMLLPEWNKVGIGYAVQDGNVFLVQIFGNQ